MEGVVVSTRNEINTIDLSSYLRVADFIRLRILVISEMRHPTTIACVFLTQGRDNRARMPTGSL